MSRWRLIEEEREQTTGSGDVGAQVVVQNHYCIMAIDRRYLPCLVKAGG